MARVRTLIATGDNARTAAAVALQVEVFDRKNAGVIVDLGKENALMVEGLHGNEDLNALQPRSELNLVVTGRALEFMLRNRHAPVLLGLDA